MERETEHLANSAVLRDVACQVLAATPSRWDVAQAEALMRETKEPTYEPRDEYDAQDLSQAGWGVVFPKDLDPEIQEALAPLIERRKEEAAATDERRFRVLSNEDAYQQGELPGEFLERRNSFLGAVDPNRMPTYLLLIGTPDQIPYSFQFGLDLRHAVGRLAFDTADEFHSYVQSVLAYEKAPTSSSAKHLALFGTRLEDDWISQEISDRLLTYLASELSQRKADWQVSSFIGEPATTACLQRLMGGDLTPDLLFTACHGLSPDGLADPEADAGAIYCQDRRFFSANSLAANPRLQGLITVHYGCHSAGLAGLKDYGSLVPLKPRHQERAKATKPGKPLVARLPQRLLGHPQGGALAVLAHVDAAYGFSFLGALSTHQPATFEDLLHRLMRGLRVGLAKELLDFRFAQLAAELASVEVAEAFKPGTTGDRRLSDLGTAIRDARNYVVLGDPAVHISSEGT